MTIIYEARGQVLGIFAKWDRYGSNLHKVYIIIYKKCSSYNSYHLLSNYYVSV